MKRSLIILTLMMFLLSLLISCRPPELEGAFVDFNAGRYDNALKLAEESTQKYPANPEAWFLLGKIYGKKSMFPEMVNAYDKSLAIGPAHKAEIENEKAYYFQTKYNDAVTKYNSFTKIEDKSSENAKKALENAISDFKNAITLKSTDYSSHRLAALCYSLLDNDDEAVRYYKKLTELYPDTVSSWLDLGIFYYNTRDYETAIDYLKKAADIAPTDPEPITYLAQSYDFAQQRNNAIDAYKMAIGVNPEEKALPFNLGLLYIKAAGDTTISEDTKVKYLEESIVNFQRVIELDSEIKEAHQLKSTGEIRLEKWDDARITLLNGLSLFPEDADMWNNLGVCYARLNDKAKAEEAFGKAKELGGE